MPFSLLTLGAILLSSKGIIILKPQKLNTFNCIPFRVKKTKQLYKISYHKRLILEWIVMEQ